MIFTIAIPTYNNATTIHLAIESSINQEYSEEYEILVFNNNCTDNTTDILNKYYGKIRVVSNEHTVTMYENHNLCLQNAQGDYIIFCHSDDQLLPDALTKYYDIIKKRNFPKRYVLWGRSMFRDYYSAWVQAGYEFNQIASGINALDPFIVSGGVTPSGTCYSRLAFVDIGGFIESKHRLSPSDWVTLWKLAINYFEFEMTDRIFFNRMYASTATSKNSEEKFEAISEVFENLFKILSNIEKNMVVNHFLNSNYFNIYIFRYLRNTKLVQKSILRRKLLYFIIKDPLCLKHKSYIQLLISLL